MQTAEVAQVAEKGNWNCDWTCDKWSQEAVDFAARKLLSQGIEATHTHNENFETGEMTWDNILQDFVPKVVVRPVFTPVRHGVSSEMLRKVIGEPEECIEIKGNLLVNEGIQRMLDFLIGAVSNQVAGNVYSNTNSYIGVGDTATAAAATDVELLATANAANRFYKVMNATFPSRSAQTVTFAADFATGEANFAWNEWTIAAGATSASGSGFLVGTTNLNRKVQSLGTKASGVWTLSGAVTVS